MTNPETPVAPSKHRHHGAHVALAVGIVLAAVAGLAWANGLTPASIGHGFCRAGHLRDFAEFRIHRALRQVGATQVQEDQILAIIDAQIAKHQAMAGVRQELHDKIAAALTADTVDRAALEAVRVEAIQRLDAGSKELVKAVADAAEVLTPAQRRQLAELHRQQCE